MQLKLLKQLNWKDYSTVTISYGVRSVAWIAPGSGFEVKPFFVVDFGSPSFGLEALFPFKQIHFIQTLF